MPAVILFSGWRVMSLDQGALHYLESHTNKTGVLSWPLLSFCLEVSVAFFAQPHHLTNTVGSYPIDALLWPRKMNLTLCFISRHDESPQQAVTDTPRIAALDFWPHCWYLPGSCVFPLALHLLTQCNYFHVSPGLKGRTLSRGLAACSSVTYQPMLCTLSCVGGQGRVGQEFFK